MLLAATRSSWSKKVLIDQPNLTNLNSLSRAIFLMPLVVGKSPRLRIQQFFLSEIFHFGGRSRHQKNHSIMFVKGINWQQVRVSLERGFNCVQSIPDGAVDHRPPPHLVPHRRLLQGGRHQGQSVDVVKISKLFCCAALYHNFLPL